MALTPWHQPQAVVDRNSCRKKGEPHREPFGSVWVCVCVNCSIGVGVKASQIICARKAGLVFLVPPCMSQEGGTSSRKLAQCAHNSAGRRIVSSARDRNAQIKLKRYSGVSAFLCLLHYVGCFCVCVCVCWVWEGEECEFKAGAPVMWGLKCLERLLFARAGWNILKFARAQKPASAHSF